MLGYKHPCKYCNQLIPPNSNVCPLCGKVNPLGPYRCPKCRAPIEKNWKACSRCGLALEITCPSCKKTTFFGDYCQHCDAPLWIECKNCHTVQPITSEKCVNCGKKLQWPRFLADVPFSLFSYFPLFHFTESSCVVTLNFNKSITSFFHCSGEVWITLPIKWLRRTLREDSFCTANLYRICRGSSNRSSGK